MARIPKYPDWMDTYRLIVLYTVIMLIVFLLSL